MHNLLPAREGQQPWAIAGSTTRFFRAFTIALVFLLCVVQQGALLHELVHVLSDIAAPHATLDESSSISDQLPDAPDEPCLTCIALACTLSMAASIRLPLVIIGADGSLPPAKFSSEPHPEIVYSRARAPPFSF